tara:strand:- start:134 stop:442 length:309 start_codon:yes stop_codon:yes gene_type:complete
MVIVETKFIKENPQLRREVEEEMRFGNIIQQEAEQRIARKHNIRSKSMSESRWNDPYGKGRWIKMLKKDKEEKMAGAVTTASAPSLFNRRYGKKKKKEDDEE